MKNSELPRSDSNNSFVIGADRDDDDESTIKEED
jgi:hypothetical protein